MNTQKTQPPSSSRLYINFSFLNNQLISHFPCHFKYILNNPNSLNNLRSIIPTFITKKRDSKRLYVLPKTIQLANVEAISHHCIHLTSWYTYFIKLPWLHTLEGQPRGQPILALMGTVSGVLISGTYGVFSKSIWLFRKKGMKFY